MASLIEPFRISISWVELVKRTVKEFLADDCLGMAAQLAYYFFLALFPALLFVLALASFFSLSTVADQAVSGMASFLPPDVLSIIRDQIQRISNGDQGGLLTVGIAGAIWSSSAAIVSIISTLNKAYDIEEARSWWVVRLVAVGLTLGLAVFILAAFSLVVAGPTIASFLADRLGLGNSFEQAWNIVRWPIAGVLVAFALGLVFYFGPDAEQYWEWVTPGAVLATLLWLAISYAFRLYVVHFTDYNAVYGTIGGVIVLMLWFYVSGLAILAGAEMNAEIEHAAPHGKAPGEKVPGKRKQIGRLAAEAYRARELGILQFGKR